MNIRPLHDRVIIKRMEEEMLIRLTAVTNFDRFRDLLLAST